MDAKEFLNEFKRMCDFYGKEECWNREYKE